MSDAELIQAEISQEHNAFLKSFTDMDLPPGKYEAAWDQEKMTWTICVHPDEDHSDLAPLVNPDLLEEIEMLLVDKGWRDPEAEADRTGLAFPAHIAMLHSEVSEALEEWRVARWSETREDGKPIGVGPEFADVLIRLIDTANLYDIDLDYEIRRVMSYNWTREYRHGGKAL
jgi:NTP pyrophosphatase (non-canonical NTP hydrolase)